MNPGYADKEVPTPFKGLDHIEENLSLLADVADVAEQLASRIAGAFPEASPQKGAPLSQVPTTVSANLHTQAERIQSATQRIRTALGRIDQVI